MTFRLLLLTFLFLAWTITAQASVQPILGTVIALGTRNMEIKIPHGALVSVKLVYQVRPKDNSQSNEPPAVGNRVIIKVIKRKKVLIRTVGHYSAAKNIPVAIEPP